MFYNKILIVSENFKTWAPVERSVSFVGNQKKSFAVFVKKNLKNDIIFLTVLDLSVQVGFRVRNINPFRGPFRERMKAAWCTDFYFEQFLFRNAFWNNCCFQDIRGQRFAILALKPIDIGIT